MRRIVTFPCAGDTLVGTLDAAPGTTGLLIVSGGNEVRAGAHRGMALLARRLAHVGIPVFRFDRRGVGDSSGENRGFANSPEDIAAAAATFRGLAPGITRLVGFGNCDAATALGLFHRAAGLDALILANPWVVEPIDDLPPTAAIRRRYAERLRDPHTWLRALTGGVDFRKAFRGLRRISATQDEASPLHQRLAATLSDLPVTWLVAEGDATAQAFAAANRSSPMRGTFVTFRTASHSFAAPGDAEALEAAIRAAL